MGEVCKVISSLSSGSASGPSVKRELSNWLEPDLLRGVALHHCIYGWRRTLAREGKSIADFKQSRPVVRLNNFLSHDWRTQGWLKVVTLVILFNSKAAALCTFCISIVVGFLRGFGILPDEFWTNFIGHATFIFVLIFWQKILASLWKPRMVFLDRLCIAQHDPLLKERGILGLAAFLDRSDELTILWSSHYFRRLWCTYEIATYFRRRKMDRPIQLMPGTLSVIILSQSINWFLMAITYHIISDQQQDELSWRRNVAIGSVCILFANIIAPWSFYLTMQMNSELQEMPAQLKQFRVQEAESSCCSKQHINTETFEAIPCDRQLVFSALRSWYRSDEEHQHQEAHLDEFNRLVQRRLAPLVLRTAGGDALPLRYTWYMIGCCDIPFMAQAVSRILHGRPQEIEGFGVII